MSEPEDVTRAAIRENLVQQLLEAREGLGLTPEQVAPFFGEDYMRDLTNDELRAAIDIVLRLSERLKTIDESERADNGDSYVQF